MDIESDGLSINDSKYDGDDERRDIDDDERRDVDHEYETSDAYSSHVTENYFEDVCKYDGDDEHDSETDSKKIKKRVSSKLVNLREKLKIRNENRLSIIDCYRSLSCTNDVSHTAKVCFQRTTSTSANKAAVSKPYFLLICKWN